MTNSSTEEEYGGERFDSSGIENPLVVIKELESMHIVPLEHIVELD